MSDIVHFVGDQNPDSNGEAELHVSDELLLEAGLTPELLANVQHLRPERVTRLIDPDNVVMYQNIRAYDASHIAGIAADMAVRGQLQPCIGDTVVIDGEQQVRVLAGLHRTKAMQSLNAQLTKHGYAPMLLRVDVYPRELSPYEVFQIQLAENRHAAMKPHETAHAIELMWEQYESLMEGVGKKPTVAAFSRAIGRGVGQVSDALIFMRLDPFVIQIVKNSENGGKRGGLFYSTAIDIGRRIAPDRQFQIACELSVMKDYTPARARRYIDDLLRHDPNRGGVGTLFDAASWDGTLKKTFRESLRSVMGEEASQAAGYFRRIIRLHRVAPQDTRLVLTEGVKDVLAQFIAESDAFLGILIHENPSLADELVRRSVKVEI